MALVWIVVDVEPLPTPARVIVGLELWPNTTVLSGLSDEGRGAVVVCSAVSCGFQGLIWMVWIEVVSAEVRSAPASSKG